MLLVTFTFTVTILNRRNCSFSGNSAVRICGGILNIRSSSPTVTNSSFSGNSAYTGGGMYNRESSTPTLANVSFVGNRVTGNGAAMAGAIIFGISLIARGYT